MVKIHIHFIDDVEDFDTVDSVKDEYQEGPFGVSYEIDGSTRCLIPWHRIACIKKYYGGK